MSLKDFAIDRIREYIASGVLAPGQRLPPERELAETLGIGRNSLREALKVLEAVGLIESRVGDGTYLQAHSGASIGRAIGMALAAWGGAIVEILEARRLIEVGAAENAALRATDDELTAMAHELTAMDAAGENLSAYLRADMNFHRLVAQASHNAIVARIVMDLIDLLEHVLNETAVAALSTGAEGSGTHGAVFDAIRRRDVPGAGAAMREHLQFSSELWLALISIGATKTQPGAQRE